jgi:hypothetical protein
VRYRASAAPARDSVETRLYIRRLMSTARRFPLSCVQALRLAPLVACALLTSGCARGPGEIAAEACRKAIVERVTNKSVTLDLPDMAQRYRAEANGTGTIEAPVIFDKGVSIEARQTFTCRVQFDPARPKAEPAIIGLSFVW